MVEIIIAHTDTDYNAAAALFKEYALWLNIDLCFQDFDEELLQLQQMYAAPHGAILLLKNEADYIGCVGIRKKENGIAELKRMYIKTALQKAGLGSLLMQKALEIAVALGYQKMRLDTLANMTPAINLYKKFGFYEIEPYYFNPEENAVFFEKNLNALKR